ncbi:LysE family transporter [Altererythrobacter indicus]|uniref:LysE family transporter n=1 Tax=Altericroceibacterium indicum TaxID=374177 RepID=A0A845A793_9SPHN|nr:LysE family translocator [Altericroceibacterium indicum]MXP25133.1 LysE family transporter [Altericroceibacterium indicum]
MTILTALAGFTLAAGLLVVTPGLDMALVLRTLAVEGPRQALAAAAGVVVGVLAWGLIVALGLGALLALSGTLYTILQYAGAAYLLWLGLGMVRAALKSGEGSDAAGPALAPAPSRSGNWFRKGLLTNLLNPKMGVFYVSFLPQFIPAGASVMGFSLLLASLHAVLGMAWFALLILGSRPLRRWFAREAVTRWLDGLTGGVLIALGLRIAFHPAQR